MSQCIWKLSSLVCVTVLMTACGVSGPPKAEPAADAEATAEKAKEEVKEEKAEPAESLEDKAKKTWAWQARDFGRVVKEQVEACKTQALDKISPPGAAKMMPSVSLADFRNNCEALTTHYNNKKEALWGTHYSLDSLLGNLAKFTDAHFTLLVVWGQNKPSADLQDALQRSVNAARALSRSAGLVAGFELTVKPMHEKLMEDVTRGTMRATVTRIVREADGPDMEQLLPKLEAYAVEPAAADQAVHKYSLEHFGQMFRRRMLNRRIQWKAMKSGIPSYDQSFQQVVGRYLNSCDALVKAYMEAAMPYLGQTPPGKKEGKAAVKSFKKVMDRWMKVREQLPEDLAAIPG